MESVQFVGTIDEPVQIILKACSSFKILPGFGAQALNPNLRVDLDGLLYGKSPSIVISGIDQSEADDEGVISELIVRHIKQLLRYARSILIYKIQYWTPSVINNVCYELNYDDDVQLEKAFFVKPNGSGPYSLEVYLILKKSVQNRLIYLNPFACVSWRAMTSSFFNEIADHHFKQEIIDIRSKYDVLNLMKKDFFFYFGIRAANALEYKNGISAAATLTDRVEIIPIGDRNNYEFLIYGMASVTKMSLTRRAEDVGMPSITQGGSDYPLTGPYKTFKTPVLMHVNDKISIGGFFNLATKIRVKKLIREFLGDNKNALIVDIGGRACESISAVPIEAEYSVIDPHPFFTFLTITLHNDQLDFV
ncbi:MAG: hypothetical protein H9Q66_05690 [Spiroplasma ixodetis]|nr:hypothetical protein [Spiroplasma ixodetis]